MMKVGETPFLFLIGWSTDPSLIGYFLSTEEVECTQGQKRKRSEDDENNED